MRSLLKPFLALAGLLAVLPGEALAAAVTLCPGQVAASDADGRVFRHLPYADALAIDLVVAPPGFSVGQTCRVQHAAAADLIRLLRDADAVPEVAGRLRGISCFRSIEHQRQVFCAPIGSRHFPTAESRAQFVAPPGYSEHATGYAIDFGLRPAPGCADVDSCILGQPGGKWLLAHAREYGFELSFPAFNKQGVTWEPWHWRWVGVAAAAPDAAKARAIFARARTLYPANPALPDPPPAPPKPPEPPIKLHFPRIPGT